MNIKNCKYFFFFLKAPNSTFEIKEDGKTIINLN